MSDKNKKRLEIALILVAIFLLWLIFNKKQPPNVQNVIGGSPAEQPMLNFFANHPTMFLPQKATVEGGKIDINIGNQGLNMLSDKYIPLFGFVGMAHSDVWH